MKPRTETLAAASSEPHLRLRTLDECRRKHCCGYCGWSWASGNAGELLCLNPESPHAYDVVPVDLRCSEQNQNPG
jgi:hypothetical protein